MPQRTGSATLPLHSGKAPRWLFDRMSQLAPAMAEVMVLEHGRSEFLKRLADPYWCQSFGCVLGFVWHLSGVSTTVCGAVRGVVAKRGKAVGVFVEGGSVKGTSLTEGE